ncbi:MAG: biopolymer transporter ExbD [Marinomonas sp.]
MGAKSPRRRAVRRGKRRGGFSQYDHGEPIKTIDTRPMAFVFGLIVLVLLLFQKMPTNALLHDFRTGPEQPFSYGYLDETNWPEDTSTTNEVFVTADERILWNCERVSTGQLHTLLQRMEQISPKPTLKFEPDPNLNYDFAVRILHLLKATNVTRLKLDGLENHANFNRFTVGNSGSTELMIALTIAAEPIPPINEAQVTKASMAKCPNTEIRR